MEDKVKTILVTGGAGFIGSHLCAKYLGAGHRVICVDNLQTTGSTRNIDQFSKNPNFRFLKHDIIEPIMIQERIDWIFNFACSGAPATYQYDPVHTTKTSTIGAMNMLNLAREHGARIMQASTSEIYGDPLESPQKETYRGNVSAIGLRACYDEGKRVAETLFMDYHREYGTDVKIIRIFNTYGSNMDLNDRRAVTNFIVAAVENQPLRIFGDGTVRRSFQHIDDLLAGIDRMMNKNNFTGPVNLGNPSEELTIVEFAKRVIKAADSKSTIVYEPAVSDDPKRRCPDITLAKKEFDWEPRVSLDEGLQKTIPYFRTAPKPESNVLVFTTTYYPVMGPAEEALAELSLATPNTHFHIVTTKFQSGLRSIEEKGKDTIYRIGFGNRLDKFLLPIFGALRARSLSKTHRYQFVWSIMASYGGLAAFFFRLFGGRDVSMLVTLDPDEVRRVKGKTIRPFIYRAVLGSADSLYVSDPETEKDIKLLAPDRPISVMASDSRGFMNQVRVAYARLLNQKQKKLDRPK